MSPRCRSYPPPLLLSRAKRLCALPDRYSHVLSLDASRTGVALLADSIDTTTTTEMKPTPEQVISDARTLVQSLTVKNVKSLKEKLLKLLLS